MAEAVMTDIAKTRREGRIRRHRRVRKKVHGTATRPRLAVYRSNKHIAVQVIDDDAGAHARRRLDHRSRPARRRQRRQRRRRRPASATSSPSVPRPPASPQVVFDRGGYAYHGRVAAIAEAARNAGLEF